VSHFGEVLRNFGEFRLMLLVIGRGAVLVEWYRCSYRMLLFCKVSTNVWFFRCLCAPWDPVLYTMGFLLNGQDLCVGDVFPVSTVAHFGWRSIVKIAVL